MDIKILIATHKSSWLPNDECYLPIQVGAEGKPSLGYQSDNTGDNISWKNPHYCELTALYWAWKNLQSDYVGLVHYRRMFTHHEVRSVSDKRKAVLTTSNWKQLLSEQLVVVPDKRNYYIENNLSHYLHAHHHDGMKMAEAVIRMKYPTYADAFDKVMNRTWAHMFNMFVMRKDLYDVYCEWLFDILQEVEIRLSDKIVSWTPYEQRVYGFVSELLFDVWLEKNQLSYKEQNVSFLEKQDWIKKGGLFLKRKLIGNAM